MRRAVATAALLLGSLAGCAGAEMRMCSRDEDCTGRGVCLQPEGRCGCRESGQCSESQFCHKPEGMCEAAGVCEPRPSAAECSPMPRTTCGCDGREYTGGCQAALARVSVRRYDSCQ